MKLIRAKNLISNDPWLIEDFYPHVCQGTTPKPQAYNIEQVGLKENIEFLKEAFTLQGVKRIEYITKEAAQFVDNVDVGKDVEFKLARPLLLHFEENPKLETESELLIMPYTPKNTDCFTNKLYDGSIGYMLFPEIGRNRDYSIVGKKGYLIINSFFNTSTNSKSSRTFFLTEDQAKRVWDDSDNPCMLDETMIKEGFLFGCKYCLLLQTRYAPLEGIRETLEEEKRLEKDGSQQQDTKRCVPRKQVIHLSSEFKKAMVASHGEKLDVSGLTQVSIMVSGHLRNQPCGPGGKDRKLIYIAPFEQKHWIRDGLVIRKNLV